MSSRIEASTDSQSATAITPEEDSQLTVMPPPKRKTVRYASTCAVILIPSRREYIDAGIDLWYNRKDQASAQSQVANELKQLITFNPALSIETAMKFLYQPHVHQDSTLFGSNSGDDPCCQQEPLHVMVIDKHDSSAKETAHALSQVIQNYHRWNVITKHTSSSEAAVKHFTSGTTAPLDVVLVDESLFEAVHMMHALAAVVNIFRSAYGKAVLIGVCLSNTADSGDIRECAVRVGVDFVWAKPVHLYVDMLPLMLVARAQLANKNSRRAGAPQEESLGSMLLHTPVSVVDGYDHSHHVNHSNKTVAATAHKRGDHGAAPSVFSMQSPTPTGRHKHLAAAQVAIT